MPAGELFAEPRPNQSFDFSRTHTNSDLDTTFVELGMRARVSLRPGLHLSASYRYLDFEDDAPYLGDGSGTAELFGLGLGWEF